MESNKTLTKYLFDTLDRLSSATPDTVKAEVEKATAIIQVSEQVLEVAKLKLDIIQSNANINEQFKEIDDIVDDKKKLTN